MFNKLSINVLIPSSNIFFISFGVEFLSSKISPSIKIFGLFMSPLSKASKNTSSFSKKIILPSTFLFIRSSEAINDDFP